MSKGKPTPREYSPAELALFDEWRAVRIEHRPSRCHFGAACWAMQGPPALTTNYGCVGCGGTPRARQVSLADAR